MDTALNIITILVAILLITMIMVQTKGSSFGTGFGGGGSMYTTRRGFEKTLFTATIGVAVFFVLLSIINSFALS
ncbi:MAG TPA: preprotein translocase subunit SecG [Thermomicrobiales bacterium]|nr:preprotein translocase subunit SecG [Thermomicrobiales bacterium]